MLSVCVKRCKNRLNIPGIVLILLGFNLNQAWADFNELPRLQLIHEGHGGGWHNGGGWHGGGGWHHGYGEGWYGPGYGYSYGPDWGNNYGPACNRSCVSNPYNGYTQCYDECD